MLVTLPADQEADHARFLASAPGNPAGNRHTLYVRRRTATSATFVTRILFGSAQAFGASSE